MKSSLNWSPREGNARESSTACSVFIWQQLKKKRMSDEDGKKMIDLRRRGGIF